MKYKNLILITAEFPYGKGEPFLETEIIYLAKQIEKIIIFSNATETQNIRQLPPNCEVYQLPRTLSKWNKLYSLLRIFHLLCRKEIQIIQKIYQKPITRGIITTLLISLQHALKMKSKIETAIPTQEEENTILYSYWCDDAAIALSLIKREKPSLKCICRIHGWDVFFERSAFNYLPYRHLISHSLDAVFSISQAGIEYAQQTWKVNTSNFFLSRLGVQKQYPLDYTKNSIFTIASCSSLIPLKRVDIIAQVVKLLDGKIPIRWVHIGDGKEKNKVEEFISSLTPTTTVILTGNISNQEVITVYRKYTPHIFINASLSEGIPVSIMEAMSLGIPVIAPSVGGIPEIVNNENGWLLKSGFSAEELAEIIFEIFKQKIYLKKRDKAYLTWRDLYDADKNYNDFCAKWLLL